MIKLIDQLKVLFILLKKLIYFFHNYYSEKVVFIYLSEIWLPFPPKKLLLIHLRRMHMHLILAKASAQVLQLERGEKFFFFFLKY